MDKKKYFFVLYILAFGYLINSYTASIISLDVSFVLTMLWGVWGWFKYSRKIKHHYLPGVNPITIVITACLLISPLVPYFYYDQPYLNTIISQRFNYAIFLLPIIAKIRPSEKDLFEPMRICAFITVGYFVISIFFPDFFYDQEAAEKFLLSKSENKTTDIGTVVPGVYLTAFYTFYKLTVVWRKYNKKDLYECVILLSYFVAYQNRSTLIGLLPLVIMAIYKFLKRGKSKAILIITLLFAISSPALVYIYQSLSQETEGQMGMDDYPRLLAFNYFVVEAKDSIVKILFGNGVWTEASAYRKLVESWSDRIYVSDLGLLGTYFYYGILPLVIVYRYVILTLFKRKIPVYIRYYSLWILLVPTIHCFLILSVPSNLLFVIYFYLVLYYKKSISSPNRVRLCETQT